jgi:hypothetical protein
MCWPPQNCGSDFVGQFIVGCVDACSWVFLAHIILQKLRNPRIYEDGGWDKPSAFASFSLKWNYFHLSKGWQIHF